VRSVAVRIVFPPRYPDAEPEAYDSANSFLPHDESRHFYRRDERCCVWLPWESGWKPDDADALLDFIAELAIFLNCQILFDATGIWPIPSRGHGSTGYREFLVEKLGIADDLFDLFIPLLVDPYRVAYLPCPCGSGRLSRWCHGKTVNELISKIGRRELSERVVWIRSQPQSSALKSA
jgi:hypothetical protein